MKKTILVILSAALLLLSSCSNTITAPDDSWESIFLQYWNQMNTEFVHFSDDSSYDWDKVYEKYLPLFQSLDFSRKSDSLKAFRYFKEIAYNAHDYHYTLTVSDGFGQKLDCMPGILKKYAAAKMDIMDFPDITVVEDNGEAYTSTINSPETSCIAQERIEQFITAIPSYMEVQNLMLNASGRDDNWGKFHSTDGNIVSDFGSSYYGYTFSAIQKTESMSKDDKTTVDEWNAVVQKIGLKSYFYGVTTDGGILYIYFSRFGNTDFLSDILIKAEASLTEEDKILLKDADLKDLRAKVQSLIAKAEDSTKITDSDLRTEIIEGVKGITGLNGMYNTLLSATTGNKCTINGVERNVKGIAVDLRGNGGGSVNFLSKIWGTFFPEEDVLIGYLRYKSGYSRYEYTPWTTLVIEKKYCNKNLSSAYSNPVAVIVNGYSVSCSELSCVVARELSSSCIIGQQTFGATCPLTDRKIYNGGPFSSAYLSVYTSTFQFVDRNKVSYEGVGITPDIKPELSEEKDYTFIEAVKWLKDKANT